MDSRPTLLLARRLETAFARHGARVGPAETLEILSALTPDGSPAAPLTRLDQALRWHGVALAPPALFQLARALLGGDPPHPGASRRETLSWVTLGGIAELHDVSRPAQIRALALLLAGEEWLVPDLLRARPWLVAAGPQTPAEVLESIFEAEWEGFLAHLGVAGPWVYAQDIARLQSLARRYAALLGQVAAAGEATLLDAALGQWPPAPSPSLLARLAVRKLPAGRAGPSPSGAALPLAEHDFWKAAILQAQERREEWGARRS